MAGLLKKLFANITDLVASMVNDNVHNSYIATATAVIEYHYISSEEE